MAYATPTPFCSPSDLILTGGPSSALGVTSPAQQQACCDRANGEVGARLAGRFPGINVNGGAGWTWSADVTGWAVAIAWKRILDLRGRAQNQSSADALIDANYKDAIAALDAVQRQALHPAISPTEAAGATSQGPVLISFSQLGTNSPATGPNRGI